MKKLLIPALIAILLLAGCDEKTLQYNSVYIPTSEAETVDAADTTDTSAQETTPPQELGPCFLKEQIYYNANGVEQAKMTVTLNEDGMPETIFIDSGTDVTHTIYYDEQGVITKTIQIQELYENQTVHVSKYNEQGERTKITLNAGTDAEELQETSYVYDSEGRIIQKDNSKNGKFASSETVEYDEQGNVAAVHTQEQTGTSTTTYKHTYKNGLLVQSQRFPESDGEEKDPDQIITYAYDEDGKIIKKKINNSEIYTFSYNEDGALEQMIVTRDNYMYVCEYNEQGNFKVQYIYDDGNLTGKVIYVWEAFPAQPTDAQLKILDLLGIVIPNFATV